MNIQLDEFAQFFLQRQQEFEEAVTRKAKKLRLGNFLEELEARGERVTPRSLDIHSFKVGDRIEFALRAEDYRYGYDVRITPEALTVDICSFNIGAYRGVRVRQFYDKVSKVILKEAAENPLPF